MFKTPPTPAGCSVPNPSKKMVMPGTRTISGHQTDQSSPKRNMAERVSSTSPPPKPARTAAPNFPLLVSTLKPAPRLASAGTRMNKAHQL